MDLRSISGADFREIMKCVNPNTNVVITHRKNDENGKPKTVELFKGKLKDFNSDEDTLYELDNCYCDISIDINRDNVKSIVEDLINEYAYMLIELY